MVLCGEKIVDGRKAESKIPVPDYYEGELFMTVISNMRSLNNDRVKRLRVDVRFLRTRRESSGLDACGQDETIAILPLGQRLRCAICGACLETVYRIITVLQSMSFTAAITEVFNQNVRAHFFSVYVCGVLCRHCCRQRNQQQTEYKKISEQSFFHLCSSVSVIPCRENSNRMASASNSACMTRSAMARMSSPSTKRMTCSSSSSGTR